MQKSSPVLLVEDDADIRSLILEALQINNVSAVAVDCGSEAINELHKKLNPSLILLDLMMPNTDGVWFCEERKKFPEFMNIPVVILTADNEIKEKAAQLKVSGFLKKPLSIESLMATINKYSKAPN
jgi:two-component system chemotaxis response regulator CheY